MDPKKPDLSGLRIFTTKARRTRREPPVEFVVNIEPLTTDQRQTTRSTTTAILRALRVFVVKLNLLVPYKFSPLPHEGHKKEGLLAVETRMLAGILYFHRASHLGTF
jgi:hypothetical protein